MSRAARSPNDTLSRRVDRLSIGVAMLLVAGAAMGLWLVSDDLRRLVFQETRSQDDLSFGSWDAVVTLAVVFILGGLSLVGPPLLLLKSRGRPWGAGRLLWFAHGTASWLLWPPIIYRRMADGNAVSGSVSGLCYYYGTPLMAVYVTFALLAGGRLRRSRRRRILRSWQETFGLLLGLAWACTGLYLIAVFYRRDFFGK
jgi:hypothetical protein